MTPFEMRLKTGLIEVPVVQQPEIKLCELQEKARLLIPTLGTLRKVSELTGIQITRVHRLVVNKGDMKVTEMLQIFSAANKKVVLVDQ